MSDDVTIHEVLRIVSKIQETQYEHIKETNRYRDRNDRLVNSHKEAIQKNGDAIICLKDYFLEFEKRFDKDYKPILQGDLERRKWWHGIYEEQKKRSMLMVTGIVGMAVFVGAGAGLLFLVNRLYTLLMDALRGIVP